MALPDGSGNAAISIEPVRIYRPGEIIPCAPVHQAQGLAEGASILVGTAGSDAIDFMCIERLQAPASTNPSRAPEVKSDASPEPPMPMQVGTDRTPPTPPDLA